MSARTSHSHPLRLDLLPAEALGTRGRLGLTLAPGKKQDGVTGRWERDLATDLERLRDEFRVGAIVNLLEKPELTELGLDGYVGTVRAFRSFDLKHSPVPDGGVPEPGELRHVVGSILEHVGNGTHVAVHCKGGLGRAGTVAAACLVGAGASADAALAAVRAARPGAVENAAQEQAVARFAATGVARPGARPLAPLAEARAPLEVRARFTLGEVARMRLGSVPQDDDWLWFIYLQRADDADWLHVHWSATGDEVFRARLAPRGDRVAVGEAWASRAEGPWCDLYPEPDARALLRILEGELLQKAW